MKQKVTKKLLDGHKEVLAMNPIQVLCRYYSDPKLKRVHLNFLIYLKYLLTKNPEETLYSESMLASLFNTNETQIKRWKTKLAELGYLTWKRVNGAYIRYYFILPKKVGTKVDVPEVFSDESSEDFTKKSTTERTKKAFQPKVVRNILSIQSENQLETEVSNLFLLESQGLNLLKTKTKEKLVFKDERSESKDLRSTEKPHTKKTVGFTSKQKANKVLKHWNSSYGVVAHKKAGTKVRSKASRLLVQLFDVGNYSLDEVLDSIDNYSKMVDDSGNYYGVRRIALPDFIQPGSYNTTLDKTMVSIWLGSCLSKKAPLTKFGKRSMPVALKKDPNPELTQVFVKCATHPFSSVNFRVTNLGAEQQRSLIEVVTKLKRLASEQPSNHNGSSMGINYQKAVEHCLKAADSYFSSWRNISVLGVTPNMLNTDRFWNEGFREWERENHSVQGLQFPRKI